MCAKLKDGALSFTLPGSYSHLSATPRITCRLATLLESRLSRFDQLTSPKHFTWVTGLATARSLTRSLSPLGTHEEGRQTLKQEGPLANSWDSRISDILEETTDDLQETTDDEADFPRLESEESRSSSEQSSVSGEAHELSVDSLPSVPRRQVTGGRVAELCAYYETLASRPEGRTTNVAGTAVRRVISDKEEGALDGVASSAEESTGLPALLCM
jgi:hypothetical protein